MATKDSTPSPGIEFYGGYPVYSESGIDLTLLRENLRRSMEERWQGACHGPALLSAFGPLQGRNKVSTFDPAAIVRHLVDNEVRFVVIGGLAMISHGSAYVTKDLDVCYQRTQANLESVVRAFADLHPYLRGAPLGLPFRFDVPTLQAGLNFTLTTDLGNVDLLSEVSGLGFYESVFAQSEEATMFGLKVRVLTLDGLIASKKAAGRLKDRNHVLELEELKKLRDAPQEG
jgi:predicted nucleotidyltransferase